MLRFLFYLFGAALLVSLPFASSARAETTGWTTAAVNMRTCASTGCSRILVIPAGARVSVYYCNSWCRVRYRNWRGYVYGRYISFAPYYRPVYPRLYDVPPPFIYVPPPDYRAPIYRTPRVYRPPVYRPPQVHRPRQVKPRHKVRPKTRDRFHSPSGKPRPESGRAKPRRKHVAPLNLKRDSTGRKSSNTGKARDDLLKRKKRRQNTVQ